MAQKLNTRNWNLRKFRKKARKQITQTEKVEVLMEMHTELPSWTVWIQKGQEMCY